MRQLSAILAGVAIVMALSAIVILTVAWLTSPAKAEPPTPQEQLCKADPALCTEPAGFGPGSYVPESQ